MPENSNPFPQKFNRLPLAALSAIILITHPAPLPAATPTTTAASVTRQFANTDWFSRPLAPGVVWKYYAFDNLFNSHQSISYIEADLNIPGVNIELPNLNGRKATTDLVSQVPNAVAGVNGTFFRAHGHTTYLRVNGKEIKPADTWGSSFGYSGGFVFNRNTKNYAVVGRPKNPSKDPIKDWQSNAKQYTDAMVNGPLLLRKGKITDNFFTKSGHCARNPRTIVGMKPGNKLILLVADGRLKSHAAGLTCDEMALVMKGLGCTDALSLDGGGSSIMYGRGEPFQGILTYPSTNGGYDHDPKDQRTVSNAIAVTGGAPVVQPFDARLISMSDVENLSAGQARWITVQYRNIGSKPWTPGHISITTSRPFNHASPLYDNTRWPNQATPWTLPANTVVPPGSTVKITFSVRGPFIKSEKTIKETFQLTLDGTQRIGPSDDKLQVNLTVKPRPAAKVPTHSLRTINLK